MTNTLAMVERTNWALPAWNSTLDQNDVPSAWLYDMVRTICGQLVTSYLHLGRFFLLPPHPPLTKAAGIDSISPRILRHCASSLLTPICHLFISSITTGNIPTEWCTHCIISIHKSGNKTLVNNYRPFHYCVYYLKFLKKLFTTV